MKVYQSTLKEFTEKFFVYMTLGVIASSCLGSVAAMLVLMSGTGTAEIVQMSLVVGVCMWYNASALAQLKPKLVFNSLLFSLMVSSLMVIFHLL
ncbi:MAG TPA: hypothetical protein VFD80_05870 [Flavobacteriaceae bacterium]|nr:hypothetical protein [Flavobacteriaceae bacterium]